MNLKLTIVDTVGYGDQVNKSDRYCMSIIFDFTVYTNMYMFIYVYKFFVMWWSFTQPQNFAYESTPGSNEIINL